MPSKMTISSIHTAQAAEEISSSANSADIHQVMLLAMDSTSKVRQLRFHGDDLLPHVKNLQESLSYQHSLKVQTSRVLLQLGNVFHKCPRTCRNQQQKEVLMHKRRNRNKNKTMILSALQNTGLISGH